MGENAEKKGQWVRCGHGRGALVGAAALLVAVAVVAVNSVFAGSGNYYLVSVVVIVCAMASLFVSFERRRPAARELVVLAVMCALAVAARAAFIWVPHFKPMAAIVMVAGIAFGARSGFVVGAVSAFASDFIFGLGPWTPWQMIAFGLAGFVVGLLAERGVLPRHDLSTKARVGLTALGGLFTVCVLGPLLDTGSLLVAVASITPEAAAAVYLTGLPVNVVHAVAVAVTLLLVANPLLGKLDRVRTKYGMEM